MNRRYNSGRLAIRSEKLVATGSNPVALATPQVATSSPVYVVTLNITCIILGHTIHVIAVSSWCRIWTL